MTNTSIRDWRELARRDGDGLSVSLLWSKTADRVSVVVVDQMFDAALQVDVAGACALDAFNHPFAYASGQRRCSNDPPHESFDHQPKPFVTERSTER